MKEVDVSSLEHTSWRCQYHVVFAPKYRRMEIYGKIKEDIGIMLVFLKSMLADHNRKRYTLLRN
jgi:REP element-mobilizing transposase RayT